VDGSLVIEGPVLRGGRITTGVVAVHDGRICAPGPVSRRHRIRLPEGWLVAPGLVDLQVNGLAGAEVGDDPAALAAIAQALPRHGVTAFCPTLITRDDREYELAARAFGRVSWPDGGARSLGVHLEGPFLAPGRPGAHRRSALRAPAADEVRRLAERFAPRIVTLAPELEGAADAVRMLRAMGVVVSIGHTDATAAQTTAAIEAGAGLLTHAFNAMPGIAGREPGPIGAVLAHPGVHVCVIADGVHVADENLLLLARSAGRRLVAVSDAVAAAGGPPGDSMLAGRPVRSDGVAVRDDDGRLAGSAATLAAAPAVLRGAGLSNAAAVAAAAVAPRRAVGLGARLRPGAWGDLVILDAELAPRLTVIGGRIVWEEPSAGLS
jgi:N-acetylglucosamine-6-phosphate deacetylase